MAQLVPFLLFLHVMGAIMAFGPGFAFAVMAGGVRKQPQYANFNARQVAAVTDRLVIPLAILQGVTGVLIIWAAGIPVMERTWLVIAIVLYVIALVYALAVQRRAVHRLIDLTSTPPPPGTPPGPPPPEVIAAAKRVGMGGSILGVLIIAIVFLMVVKPTF